MMVFDEIGQIIVGKSIATDHKKWLGEMFFCIFDASCRTERHVLPRVSNAHTKLRTIAKVIFYIARQILNRNNDLSNTMTLQKVENVFHYRLADNRDHRLRALNREWS